ncbi:UDP-glucose pyrophosphorylase [Thermovirga lienii DSM 17291]|jgi:UTP--glucose-1-phosphate uridylyltransferase|uniref:UTP--glucose-1-phosphate uridylyltransferase n=1 Tax=Thermovirga lienii (strain ATCC BAA-1197 / DSM 17291 / Cas60314) TaxID=580340 RepID=G7V9E5_THELD|nr:UTP--glucose-1-phosphate uridylyltransferase GalU [Thermovirga lienii]AER66495.1 UDP-glucose pyrophosphorylase [Thermovirga lienii DSM 17291]MDN5318632.1 UTP--glucose-phosphate uridylyltransferase [Thermovirga sp.]MDN5367455.1 UTP--glucose-phosphate uridylyltransferase [Thermovirga sp.]HCD72321.1 UTP--glucose-1-phosphate uridylyltransferase [Thermovirga lienii]
MEKEEVSVKTCLFPVAGLGTRFLPATKEIPKEMLPVLDKPVIAYGVEEAVSSGCKKMIFVTSKGKNSILDYFDRNLELERELERRGKKDLVEEIKRISEGIECASVRQSQPLGLGHAVLMGEPFCDEPFFGVILPDDIMVSSEGSRPVLRQLVDVCEVRKASVVALMEVPPSETNRYGIVEIDQTIGDGLFSIKGMVEKPSPEEAPSNFAIMGRYVLSSRIFEHIRKCAPGAGGEYQLTDAIRSLLEEEPVYGLVFSGKRYDCGTKEAWLRTNVALALRDEALRSIVLEEVKKVEENCK